MSLMSSPPPLLSDSSPLNKLESSVLSTEFTFEILGGQTRCVPLLPGLCLLELLDLFPVEAPVDHHDGKSHMFMNTHCMKFYTLKQYHRHKYLMFLHLMFS
uniref:Uncharacterized protein n=1 Tax=Homalodisca liturata TaxID=320908 RepID=A0A1B6JXW5_9HEMI